MSDIGKEPQLSAYYFCAIIADPEKKRSKMILTQKVMRHLRIFTIYLTNIKYFTEKNKNILTFFE